MFKRISVEIRLNAVRLDAGGDGERLLIATLVWPRPLIAERIASRPLKLESGRAAYDAADWSERILFKEQVEGPFGLVVRVTEPLSARAVARFLAQWGGALLRLAATESAKLAADPWSASLTRIPLQILAGDLGGAAKEPKIDAAGRITVPPGASGSVRVPLAAARNVYRVERRRVAGRSVTRRIRVAAESAPVGEAELELFPYA